VGDHQLVGARDPGEGAAKVADGLLEDLHLLVVGGAWRVPKVQQVLGDYIEKGKGTKLPLGQHLNGEEAAALGAALVAGNSSSSFRVKKIFFTDITMHEYAVQVASLDGKWEKNVTTLYPAGAALGAKKKLSFALEEDFEIRLFEDGVLLSTYTISGLVDQLKDKWSAYNLTGLPKITVSVPLDTSGIIEVKDPKVTVEESYWVNVTKEKPKANTTSKENTTNTSAENSTAAEEPAEAPAEEAAEAGNATAANGTAANDTEVEIVQKKKYKKHEKKLTVTRLDFKPLPLLETDIKEIKLRLEAMAKKEEEVAKVTALKNELEAGIYGSRDKLDREDIIKVSTEEQREEVTKLCTEYEEWMYEGSSEKNDYEQKVNKLKDLLGPMEERALELEAREDLPERVKEQIDECSEKDQGRKTLLQYKMGSLDQSLWMMGGVNLWRYSMADATSTLILCLCFQLKSISSWLWTSSKTVPPAQNSVMMRKGRVIEPTPRNLTRLS